MAVYVILFQEFSSLPLIDDYLAILDFSLHLQSIPAFSQKLLYAFTVQNGQYKLIVEHLIVTVQIQLMHRISIGFLVALGDILLLPILFILWKNFEPQEGKVRTKLVLFLPVVYLLFQLNYVETLDWAMAALQNITVILFALLSLHYLQQCKRSSFLLACGFSLLSAASSTNGFFLAPVGLVLLLLRSRVRRAVAWTVLFITFWAGFAFNFVTPAAAHQVSLLNKFLFFLSFLGGAAENMHGYPVRHASMVLGFCLLALLSIAITRRWFQENAFAAGAVLWIMLTAAAVSEVRVGLGMELALSVRYKIYCDLLVIFAYGLLADRIRRNPRPILKQPGFLLSAVIAVGFCACSDILGQRFLHNRRQHMEAAMRAYQASPGTMSPLFLPTDSPNEGERRFQEQGRVQLSQAIAEGLYVPPNLGAPQKQ